MIRLENLVLMAGVDLPLRAIREQIVEAMDLVIHQARIKDGSRRIVAISEITGIDDESIQLQEIFRFSIKKNDANFPGVLERSGLPLNRREKFALRDVDLAIGF